MKISEHINYRIPRASILLVLFFASCVSLPLQANVNVNPVSLSFGNQSIGTTSQPMKMTLSNATGHNTTLVSISSSVAQFSYSWPSLPLTLGAAQQLTGTVAFKPTASQIYNGTLTFTFASGPSIVVSLSGTGVQAQPLVTIQPARETVITGQTATFSASVSGASPVGYQWKKNGAAISGATAAGYTTPPATTSDNAAQFTVTVSTATGSVSSNPATLTVMASVVAPSITSQPTSQTVTAGQSATFSAAATGTAPLSYQWMKNGTPITGATSSTYTTPATTTSDNSSQFAVMVSNSAGRVTSNPATLTVTSVAITVNPKSATVMVGSSQQFVGNVTGTSNTAVTWTVSGTGCTGAACGTISVNGLYGPPVSAPSPSTVTVKATSVADPTKSASASVTIVAAVAVLLSISPTSASVPTSGTQLFTASVTGTSNTAVNWSVSGAGCSGSSCGTISTSASSAVYLAPTVLPSPPSVAVNATSAADPTKSVSAQLTIVSVKSSPPPELAVTTSSDGAFHVYSTYTQINSTQYTISDSVVNATVTDLGGGKWKVNVTAKADLSSLYFPWQTNRTPLAATLTNDIYYYPYILGLTEQAPNHNVDWTWWGLPYPGSAFAPLTVMANDSSARIVAATNWPPKRVIPRYAAQRQVLYYDTPISTGNTASFSALIATVSGDAAHGNVPWQLAIDQYRTWLDANMAAVSYPAWMINAQGFLDIQLENFFTPPTATSLNTFWQPVKSYYPLVLMWGQMSPYAGGCCTLSYTFNSSYLPEIPNFTNSVVSLGYYAGYYSAPNYSAGPSGYLDTTGGVSWLSNWITSNQSSGANSFYIDTLGRTYYGNPTNVMNLFANGTIPKNSIIEGAVDIYPVAGLASGALLGDTNGCGAPQRTPQNSVKDSYPQFGRYILKDRILFSGAANTDYRFWGTGSWTDSFATSCGIPAWCSANGPCDHGAERLAFILGNKLDVMDPTNNPVLDAINTARVNSNWMQRQPVFLNTQGLDLSHIPSTSAVRITLFRDSGGKHLIAISNPRLESGLTFGFNNQTYTVPSEGVGISILDLP
jgi:hypothetical protein